VAISINLERILQGTGLPGRAGEAIVLLVAVLVVSTRGLVPGQSPTVLGAELLGAGLVAWLILVVISDRLDDQRDDQEPPTKASGSGSPCGCPALSTVHDQIGRIGGRRGARTSSDQGAA
jgi:hypothetical protein